MRSKWPCCPLTLHGPSLHYLFKCFLNWINFTFSAHQHLMEMLVKSSLLSFRICVPHCVLSSPNEALFGLSSYAFLSRPQPTVSSAEDDDARPSYLGSWGTVIRSQLGNQLFFSLAASLLGSEVTPPFSLNPGLTVEWHRINLLKGLLPLGTRKQNSWWSHVGKSCSEIDSALYSPGEGFLLLAC